MSGTTKPQCKASVYRHGWPARCARNAGHGPDGAFCVVHDREAERMAKRRERWAERDRFERARRVSRGLREATLDELRAEIARREAEAVRS